MAELGASAVLYKYPVGVKWHNDREHRTWTLVGALISNTLAMMLATIVAVIVWRRLYDLPDTNSGLVFNIFISIILAVKIIPTLFNIWRVFLWIGRTILRPKGTQHLQMAGASLVAFSWISLIVVLALKFAEPVMHFLKSTGISLHV